VGGFRPVTDESLEPIAPAEARDMYLDARREDAKYDTRQTISKGTALFTEWADWKEIENINTIRGRELTAFKNWCKNESNNNTVSLNGIMAIIRRFMIFCAGIEAVGSDVPDKTPVPTVPDDEDICYDKPTDEEVESAIRYLRNYEYASRRHVEYEVVKEIGCRMGAARSIDFEEDLKLEERVIELTHRPEKSHPDERGTPLKNQTDGERHVNISSDLAELIRDHLENPDRDETEDRFGRKPLFTTGNGRITLSSFRRDFYKLTRPCVHSGYCPHDRDVDDCEATNSRHASKCPSSYSPHPLRRWSIENQIDRGVPKEKLCDRVDVSVPILNKHYDLRSKERKQGQRLKLLEKLFPEYGDPDATIDIGLLDGDTSNEPKSTLEPDVEGQSTGWTEDETETPQNSASEEVTGEDTESETEDSQVTFNNFRDEISGVVHPGLWPVVATLALSERLHVRLNRELEDVAPESEPTSCPSANRAAKGAAAYVIFVCLVSINLSLLGLPLTTVF
jgi:integrase